MRINGPVHTPTLQNFCAQAHGAEMLRIAMILLEEAGVRVCCPVHDAVLVECAENQAEAVADTVSACMTKAAMLLLGVAPRVSITPIAYGERLVEGRGVAMWNRVMRALRDVRRRRSPIPTSRQPMTSRRI